MRNDGRNYNDSRFNEGPRHEVRISQGFWLFDTPVTQALWRAVMGGNPSCFVDPKRPVERRAVDWENLQGSMGFEPGNLIRIRSADHIRASGIHRANRPDT